MKGIFTAAHQRSGRSPQDGRTQGITHKKCRKCGAIKLLDDFYRQLDTADGRRNYCKKCTIALRMENKRANRDRESESQKRQRNQPHRKEQIEDYQRLYRWRKKRKAG